MSHPSQQENTIFPVIVAELFFPGIRIQSTDRDWANKMERLLSALESELATSAVALHYFSQEYKILWDFADQQEETDKTSAEQGYQELLNKLSQAKGAADTLRIITVSEIEEKQKRWDTGQLPKEYQRCLVSLYAKGFLLSMHTIGKLLETIAQNGHADRPATVQAQVDCFRAKLPHVVGVRDSEMHKDERLQGMARNRPINIQPIDNGVIRGGKMLVADTLNGTTFSATMADGHLGEVDVSEESLEIARECIQNVISAFKWEGHPRHCPA